ncbi:alpha-ketoglutarate-dependent dioxygenase AlkB family protein [Celerinatantimonas yamalensis]|uniref:Alpha-ketoglutarate-dependent dioxygenase AlkB n=1 Tax=Celerinatantimonas yamalensis TaxID=559956 RepID=A0ABW9GBE1_9GAMM
MFETFEKIELSAQSWLFLAPCWSQLTYQNVVQTIDWEQHYIQLFGRSVKEPRLSAWIADPHCSYRYSGQRRAPKAWPELLTQLRTDLSDVCQVPFNSVLANLYRNGNDAMGWHSDDERELGGAPMIASLSFGSERRFLLRERSSKNKIGELQLGHGSLLLMAGDTQLQYQHCIAQTKRMVAPRINLTFRHVVSKSASFE